jgi:hypothetical protein
MAEKFDHIDQKIRQKFENFEPEPPLKVWENIQSGIKDIPPSSPSGGIMLPIIVAVSLLIFLSGLVHHFSQERQNQENPVEGKSIVSMLEAGVVSTGSTTVEDLTLQQLFYQEPQEIVPPQYVTDPVEETPVNIPVRAPFDNKVDEVKKPKNIIKAETTPTQSTRSGQWRPGLVKSFASGELSYGQAMEYGLSLREIKKISRDIYYSKNTSVKWSIGLYFNPEVSNCLDNSVENTMGYNFGLFPQMQIKNFFLQSGINLRFTSDKGNYAVDYNRYLGSYEDVYDVTFDSTENGVIPIYHTETVDVFDTISHYSVSETKANYTYLEIPLFVGYKYTFGKASLFAKFGSAASFLVVERFPAPADPEEKARIIDVDYQVPLRNEINWQLMMAAGFEYKLADNISFSLEPTFRYAFKPEYNLSGSANGNTRSYGVRAGLIYNFK